MIGVVITIIVCVTIGIINIIKINRSIKRTKELEVKLTEYYKERESRLKAKGLIND